MLISKHFKKKKTILTVAILTEKGVKIAGSITLDLSKYVNGK